MLSAFPTEAVTVEFPAVTGRDAHGCDVVERRSERVAGVLAQPNGAADLSADRPNGDKATAVFHFPKTYSRSLKGCRVIWRGRAWRVAGDPQKVPGSPLPFDRSAVAEACDG